MKDDKWVKLREHMTAGSVVANLQRWAASEQHNLHNDYRDPPPEEEEEEEDKEMLGTPPAEIDEPSETPSPQTSTDDPAAANKTLDEKALYSALIARDVPATDLWFKHLQQVLNQSLYTAVLSEKLELVNRLIEHGAEATALSSDGKPLSILAAENKNHTIFTKLLENEDALQQALNYLKSDRFADEPLLYQCTILRIFLNSTYPIKKASISSVTTFEALNDVVAIGSAYAVTAWLEKANKPNDWGNGIKYKNAALQLAAIMGHTEVVMCLLRGREELTTINTEGVPLSIKAFTEGYTEIALLLVEYEISFKPSTTTLAYVFNATFGEEGNSDQGTPILVQLLREFDDEYELSDYKPLVQAFIDRSDGARRQQLLTFATNYGFDNLKRAYLTCNLHLVLPPCALFQTGASTPGSNTTEETTSSPPSESSPSP
ncbi:MAG: hypothetical protein P1U34_04740 [Coxiellaceae bacterium]|nr:hypothetical protein [Coxiellaceae bacterium]